MTESYRRTFEALRPVVARAETPLGEYDRYPAFALPSGQVEVGYDEIARRIRGHRSVVIDGYVGVMWDHFRDHLDGALRTLGVKVGWTSTLDAFVPPAELLWRAV